MGVVDHDHQLLATDEFTERVVTHGRQLVEKPPRQKLASALSEIEHHASFADAACSM